MKALRYFFEGLFLTELKKAGLITLNCLAILILERSINSTNYKQKKIYHD